MQDRIRDAWRLVNSGILYHMSDCHSYLVDGLDPTLDAFSKIRDKCFSDVCLFFRGLQSTRVIYDYNFEEIFIERSNDLSIICQIEASVMLFRCLVTFGKDGISIYFVDISPCMGERKVFTFKGDLVQLYCCQLSINLVGI
jgi:hypothetical protein